jgi:c-di-GMP-binding flagellar brake protein YcgR
MADANQKLLHDAVDRNQAAVLSVLCDGLMQHCKSRFLKFEPQGLWIESDSTRAELIDDIIARQATVAVSFKTSGQRVSFASSILIREPQFVVNEHTTLEALLLKTPDDVKVVQRRVDYRVRVAAADSELVARVWRIKERADVRDVPPASCELPVDVRDLSLGGIGLIFKGRGASEAPKVSKDERLRVLLKYDKEELVMEGRVRHLPDDPAPGGGINGGVQFAKLNKDIKGRQKLATLTKIVGLLQREEVRRTRLGLMKAG